MFLTKVFNNLRPQKQCLYLLQTHLNQRLQSSKSKEEQPKAASNQTLGGMGSKYQVFRDEDSEVILDLYEERHYGDLLESEERKKDLCEGLNLEREDKSE